MKLGKKSWDPGEDHSVVLQAGDGMIYKGCERPHWRDPMPKPRRKKRDIILRRKDKEYYYHQIFLSLCYR